MQLRFHHLDHGHVTRHTFPHHLLSTSRFWKLCHFFSWKEKHDLAKATRPPTLNNSFNSSTFCFKTINFYQSFWIFFLWCLLHPGNPFPMTKLLDRAKVASWPPDILMADCLSFQVWNASCDQISAGWRCWCWCLCQTCPPKNTTLLHHPLSMRFLGPDSVRRPLSAMLPSWWCST